MLGSGGVGRRTTNYVGYRESESSSSSSEDGLENLLVYQQSETEYDAAGNVLVQTVRLRWHNATGTGPLAGPATEPKSRDSFVLSWYDGIGRRVARANYGTNGNAGAPTRPASAPSASDTILVSLAHYNDRGEAFESVGPDGKIDRSYADDAGRQTLSVRNFVPPGSGCYSPGEEQNVVVRRTYLAGGRLGELIAVNPNTGDQVTTYEYGVTLSGSDLASNDLLAAEVYPDSTGSSDQVSYAYDRQGQTKSMVDQRGTTHAYAYDALGRRTADSVTALGGADGAVRRIGMTYDVRGLVEKATSFSDASGTTVVSEIKNAYNDFGQRTVQWQEHGGAVNTSSSPKVQYAYADGSANTIRPTSMTYPDGVVLEYLYSDDAANALSRPQTLWFDGDEVCTYAYLGTSSFVQVNYPEPEVRLTSFLGSGSDLYAAFDRFGRTIEQRWQTFANPTTKLVQLKYGYDRASNRLWREDVAAAGLGVDLDELYAYDGMDRLEAFYRGDLDEEHDSIGTASAQQAWDLDAVGNWQNFSETVGANSLDQQRTFNTVNEITDISKTVGPNWADPVYDAAGNMTRITRRAASPDRWAATWDAWNRLVKLEESDGEGGWLTKQENAYDAINRRIFRKTYVSGSIGETRHYYWTASWQGIEERVVINGIQEPERQYVYGLRYIDDVVLRDRDTQVGDSGSSSDALVYDERLYAMQDANWNVVALCDDLGTVQRRYAYQPYGDAIGLNASFGSGGPNVQWTKTFASYEYDRDVDLFQVRWRWYSPLLGGWVSRDRVGYKDGMNLYGAYSVPGSTDPSGLGKGKVVAYVVERMGGRLVLGRALLSKEAAAKAFAHGSDILVTQGRTAAKQIADKLKGRFGKSAGKILRHDPHDVGFRPHYQLDDIPGRHIFYAGLATIVGASAAASEAGAAEIPGSTCKCTVDVRDAYEYTAPVETVLVRWTVTWYAGEDSAWSYLDWINPVEPLAIAGQFGRDLDNQRNAKLVGALVDITCEDGSYATLSLNLEGELVAVTMDMDGKPGAETLPAAEYFSYLEEGERPVPPIPGIAYPPTE